MEKTLTEDLENWMTNLPEELRTKSIIHLAIPGSHDTMTYSISWKSKVSPDAEPIVQCLEFLGPLLRSVMSRWGRTQEFKLTEQLTAGIRYFDLRVATMKGTNKLYFVHGQYADEVTVFFDEMVKFLNEHPQEFVIVDFQHFYALTDDNHNYIMKQLKDIFGPKLVPYMSDMCKLSLNFLNDNQYQLLVIYRSDAAIENVQLWPSVDYPTPWPNTDEIDVLLSKLDSLLLNNRQSNKGFVSQCVLTPSSDFVIKNLFSSLKDKCAIPLQKQQYNWIKKQTPGPKGVNVIINDFVNLNAIEFSKEVISLNSKLLTKAV